MTHYFEGGEAALSPVASYSCLFRRRGLRRLPRAARRDYYGAVVALSMEKDEGEVE